MDDPFDKDGMLSDTAMTVMDTEDFDLWYGRAKRGDADAQYRMGVWCLDGGNRLVKEDKKEAAKWLAKAAAQGHEDAQKLLEQMSPDKGEPEHLRCYVCLAGLNVFHCYNDCDKTAAMRQKKAEEFQKKGEQILKEAEQGDAQAQLQAGYTYENGVYLPQDDAKAVEWWIKSAEQGNVEAQNRLGFYYANGKGVAKDDAKAVEWYAKAAEQGSDYAQCKLGNHYAEGKGVAKDLEKAAEWYQKAVDQGDSTAKYYLGELRKRR